MLLRNEWEFLNVMFRIEEFIDQLPVAEAQVLAAGKQLALSSVSMQQLGITGRAISCTPQVHCEPGLQPVLASTYYASHLASLLRNKKGFWMIPFQ